MADSLDGVLQKFYRCPSRLHDEQGPIAVGGHENYICCRQDWRGIYNHPIEGLGTLLDYPLEIGRSQEFAWVRRDLSG